MADIAIDMTGVILSTAAELAPRSKRPRGAQGWCAGPGVEAEMNAAWKQREKARRHLCAEPHNSNLRKAVKMAGKNIRKARDCRAELRLRIVVGIWRGGEVPQQWKDAMVMVVVVVVVVDSHIQRIVLATEETTVTQQVSHRPIKRQSRLWSQRGTKVNGSHHGDNPLLRPTGIQIATKSYAALQAMAPTNIKTVHQTSLLHSRATSIDSECCRLPTTSVLSKKPEKLRSNQF